MATTATQFDLAGAKQAGYSDDEILQHLAQSRNFDVQGALSAGYTKPEILAHLSGSTSGKSLAKPTTPPGFIAGLGHALGAPTTPEEAASMISSPQNPAWDAGTTIGGFNPGAAAENVVSNLGQGVSRAVRGGVRETGEAIQNIREGGPILSNVGKALSGYTEGLSAVNPVVAAGGEAGKELAKGNVKEAAGSFTGGMLVGAAMGAGEAQRGGAVSHAIASKVARDSGITGDLAGHVEAKVAQAARIQQAITAGKETIATQTEARITGLNADARAGVEQLQADMDQAQTGTRAALATIRQQMAAIPGQKLAATEQIVRTAAQAVSQEAARVSAPFEEMGKLAKTPVTTTDSLRSMIVDSVKERGANPAEIPPAAFRAIPIEEGMGANARYGPSGRPVTQFTDLPAEEQAKFRAQYPEMFKGKDASFRDLTRVKDDLYQAARAAKDPQVRAGLDLGRQRVIQMQEDYAKANGFGDRYAAAKRDYYQFKHELGSGVMDDFLAAQSIEDQEIAGKLGQLTSRANAPALRTLLKATGVDVTPLDELIAQQGVLKVGLGEVSRAGKAVTSDIQGRMGEVTSAAERATAAEARAAKTATSRLEAGGRRATAALSKENSLLKSRGDLELAGKSNAEIAAMKLQEQFAKARVFGLWDVGHLAMTIYGVERMIQGNLLHGAVLAGYGATRLLTPELLRTPAFQDWVIRNSGVVEPQMVNRLRAGLIKATPILAAGNVAIHGSATRTPQEVMLAAKEGRITPAQARSLTQRMGKGATITRPMEPPR